ncbi:MAG: hypothetical protein PHR11_06110, partial [Candidatus Omnitrophica bacterium]|nr:hypothetical protein [Candidatus Omnitrophota bacterium]
TRRKGSYNFIEVYRSAAYTWYYIDESIMEPDTFYQYIVKFVNARGVSDPSDIVRLKTFPKNLLPDRTPPLNLTISAPFSVLSTANLSAIFYADDPESGVVSMDYRILALTYSGVTPVTEWRTINCSPGKGVIVVCAGLNLKAGMTYYFQAYATNGAGLRTTSRYSRGITVR